MMERPGEEGVEGDKKRRVFWTADPELRLAGIEWVVVDEADVLFGMSGLFICSFAIYSVFNCRCLQY